MQLYMYALITNSMYNLSPPLLHYILSSNIIKFITERGRKKEKREMEDLVCDICPITGFLGLDALLDKELQRLEHQLMSLLALLQVVGHIYQGVHHRLVDVAKQQQQQQLQQQPNNNMVDVSLVGRLLLFGVSCGSCLSERQLHELTQQLHRTTVLHIQQETIYK